MNRITAVVLCLALQMVPAAWAQEAQTNRDAAGARLTIPDREILTGEELRQAGVLRPSDLFRLLDGWTFSPRDGWHGEANAGALGASGWEVWIDGHRATTSILGTQDLNLLPIAIENIAYVEAFRRPTFVHGVLAGQGVLQIHTRTGSADVEAGLRARAGAWMGNESGDPGPLRFLGDDTPNVDHLGPDYSAAIEWLGSDLRLAGTAVRRKHYATDAAILDRHRRLSFDYPSIALEAASIRILTPGGFDRAPARPGTADRDRDWRRGAHVGRPFGHDVVVQVSRLDDFFFLQPFGREIPVITRRIYAGAHGVMMTGPVLDVTYRASFTGASLGRRANLRNLDLDWSTDRVEGGMNVELRRRNYVAQIGLTVDRSLARTVWTLRDRSVTRLGVHLRFEPRATDRLRPAVVLQARRHDGRLRLQGMFSLSGRPSRGHTFHLAMALYDRPASEEHPIWFWTGRGYGILERLGIEHPSRTDLRPSRHLTLDGRWRAALSPRWTATAGTFARIHWNGLVDAQVIRYDDEGTVLAGPVSFAGPLRQALVGFEGELEGTILDRIRQNVHARWIPLRLGDEPARESAERWPGLELRGRWYVAPAPVLWLSAQISYRSDTRWHGYEAAQRPAALSVPAAWTIDFAATKGFWRERVYVTLAFRNLLNGTVRYHPIGARESLSLSARFLVRLD